MELSPQGEADEDGAEQTFPSLVLLVNDHMLGLMMTV